MKFELTIKIDSSNQDVVDNPNEVVLMAIDRARKEAGQMTAYNRSGLSTTLATVRDGNGNQIGTARIEFEGEDDD